jgi:hypothetical protein
MDIKEMMETLLKILNEKKEEGITEQDFPKAAMYRDIGDYIKKGLGILKKGPIKDDGTVVDLDDIKR